MKDYYKDILLLFPGNAGWHVYLGLNSSFVMHERCCDGIAVMVAEGLIGYAKVKKLPLVLC